VDVEEERAGVEAEKVFVAEVVDGREVVRGQEDGEGEGGVDEDKVGVYPPVARGCQLVVRLLAWR